MTSRYKSSLAILLILSIGFGLIYILNNDINKNKKVPKINESTTSPVIFLHGSGGSENNMVPFSKQLNINSHQPDNLKIRVQSNGELSYLNTLPKNTKQPFIFLGFEDGDAPIQEWAAGLASAIDSLDTTYHFKSYKLVGFSNGGLAAAYYVASPLSNTHKKNITHLTLLGAPFNDLDPITPNTIKSLKTETSSYFKQFIDVKDGIYNKLKVLSIAGDDQQGTLSDSIVPISSALGSSYLFKSKVSDYQEKIVPATHGELISIKNTSVIETVSDFLNQ